MGAALGDVLQELVKGGFFGEVKFVAVYPDVKNDIGAHFSSCIEFVQLVVKRPNGNSVLPLFIKTQILDAGIRALKKSDNLFFNEVLMYKEILPHLNAEKFFPKMFYCSASEGVELNNNLLILDNIKYSDYVIAKEIFLDFNHISLSMKKLGEFHALSYISKQELGLKILYDKLKPYRLRENEKKKNDFEETIIVAMARGIKPLQALHKNDSIGKILETFLEKVKNPFNILERLSDSAEPYKVLCHGDFCKNNICYKYNEAGIPIDCKFVDVQMSRYGSPVIDIVFFLYMHTSCEMRQRHWDEFLNIYWESLKKSAGEDIILPSFQYFLKEVASRAVYGYIICSFLIPMMLVEGTLEKEDCSTKNLEERKKYYEIIGGEEATENITNIVSHMLERNYIPNFLNFIDGQNNFAREIPFDKIIQI